MLNDDSFQNFVSTVSTDDDYRSPMFINEPRRIMLGAKFDF